jgi:hypothetical protein
MTKLWIIFYNGNIQSNLKEKLKYYTYKGDIIITFFKTRRKKITVMIISGIIIYGIGVLIGWIDEIFRGV